MQYTTNYNIPKFDGTDAVNPNSRNGLNSGADIVDTQLKANANNITSANANITALDTRVDALEDRQVYSTSEQVIGTWIDGKPLYRRSFYVATFSKDTYISSTAIGSDKTVINFDVVVDIDGTGAIGKDFWAVPTLLSSYYCTVQYNASNGAYCRASSQYNPSKMNLTVYYTKTTD